MSGAERRLVLAWGGNAHGQLGLGDVAEHLTPSALPPLPSPHSVCCGDYHSALVTADGALFTWGAGEAGQLGHGERRSSPSPRGVRGLDGTRVAAVACGARHTLARCAEGRVYAWGCGTFGALGLGLHAAEEVLCPALVESLPAAAAALAAGVYHSVALCEGGELFAWGWGRHGQLGDGEVGSHAFAPARVRRREAWRGVASGAHHVLAQAASGELWAWGSGEAGQLGSGERRDEPLPREVCRGAFGGREVAQFACGERHSAALTDEGRVYCWGAGVFAPPAASHGGWPHAADEAVVATPSLVEPLCHARVRSIACGFHQVCAVTVEGDVLCWQAGSAAYVALPPVAAASIGLRDGLAGVEVGCVSLECGGYHTLAIVQPRRTAGRLKGLSSPPRRGNGERREPQRDSTADETADAAAARCGGGGARADGSAGVRACVVAAYEGAAGACATRREAPPLARVPSSYVRQMGAEEGAAMAAVLAELDQLVREVDEQKRETARRKQEYEQEVEEFRREASGAEELRQKLDSSRRKLKEERQRADALQEERDQLLEKLDARATANAEVCRQHDRALRAASADARRRALLCSIVARYESGLHTRALQQWRRATARIAVAQAESIAARHAFAAIKSESHTRAALLVARLLHPPPLPPRLAWQLWASAAGALRASHASRRAAAARAAQTHAEATTAAVRRCYAADKLGALLGARGGASLRLALCRWAAVAARQSRRAALEEGARLDAQLAAETAHAAALSDRLAEAEARAAAPFGSPRGKLRERLEAEREARRQAEALAAAARGEAAAAAAAAARGELAAAAAARGEAAEAALAAARHEVRALRRFAALAGGAHRFARWRLLLCAMRVKRAEARAALAEASTARLVAAARGGAAAAGEAAAWRANVRRGALRRLVAPPPHGAMARALWRWRAGGVMLEAAAAAAAAGSAAGGEEAAQEEMLCEAIRVGDAQTQRVLQLQRAVLVARRRLAASLLHVVLSSLLRSLLLQWLHRWALAASTHCRLRAVRDARAAKADASRLSSRASSLEAELQHAKAAAAAEAEAARRKLLAAERAKGSLRAECAQAAQAAQAEQQASARERERRAAEALEATRAQSANSRREQELAAAYGENAELERQLRALRAQLRAATLGERTPPASPRLSPARTREEGIAKGDGAAAIARLERQLRLEREEKDQCESNRTRAVRDLRACKEELAAARRAAAAAARAAALARILAFARSRFGRCAQLLRLLHALRDWHDFTSLRAPAARGARPPRAPPVASRRHATLHALRVLMQQRALRWSLQMRYRCLLRWRTAAATAQWVEQGGAPRSERLHELLREVQIMKAAVGGTVARTPATRPGAY